MRKAAKVTFDLQNHRQLCTLTEENDSCIISLSQPDYVSQLRDFSEPLEQFL